MKIEEERRRK